MSTNDKRAKDYETSEILDRLAEMFRDDKNPEDQEFSEFFEEIMKREPFSFVDKKLTEHEKRCEELEEKLKNLNALIRKHIHTDAGLAVLAE